MQKSAPILRLFAFLTIVNASAASLSAATYAQLALGGNPQYYECVLLVTNKTVFEWGGKLSTFRGNKSAWRVRWIAQGLDSEATERSFTLAPGGTLKITIKSISGDLQAGYLKLTDAEGYSSYGEVTVSFFYNLRDWDGGLVDSVSVPESDTSDDAIIPVEFRAGQVNSGIAWCWDWDWEEFPINFELLDTDGHVVDTRQITYAGQTAKFVNEIFDPAIVGQAFVGHVRVKSPHYMYWTALRLEYSKLGFQLTSTAPDTYIP